MKAQKVVAVKLSPPIERREYVGISPREAVIAAHAQSNGDWNTWDYEERYGQLVRPCGSAHISCGGWTALVRMV